MQAEGFNVPEFAIDFKIHERKRWINEQIEEWIE